MQLKIPDNIIISRTDSIGDVLLTLPVAKVLKDYFPGIKISFMGKAYTRPVIEACQYIDAFLDVHDFLENTVTIDGQSPDAILHVLPVKEIAWRAKNLSIPLRIGTTNRLYHLTTCNKLVKLSRRNSPLHEAQLNLKLLAPFGIDRNFSPEEIGTSYGLLPQAALSQQTAALVSKNQYNIILHPKSQGSAREWGIDHFVTLIKMLDPAKYRIFISGTAVERAQMQRLFDAVGECVTDITGQLSLAAFIAFIGECDALVAASTGPLHIAAALGKRAIGIYPPIRPMHPGRWAPLGPYAQALSLDKECNDCRGQAGNCHCIQEVSIAAVADLLQSG